MKAQSPRTPDGFPLYVGVIERKSNGKLYVFDTKDFMKTVNMFNDTTVNVVYLDNYMTAIPRFDVADLSIRRVGEDEKSAISFLSKFIERNPVSDVIDSLSLSHYIEGDRNPIYVDKPIEMKTVDPEIAKSAMKKARESILSKSALPKKINPGDLTLGSSEQDSFDNFNKLFEST